MKILYLFSSAETSVAIVTLNQVNAFRELYPEIEIRIACVNYYPERSVLDGKMYYIKKYNSNQIKNYFESFRFIKKIKNDFKPDITISNLAAVNTFNALTNIGDLKIGIFHAPMIQFSTKNFLVRFLNNISIQHIYPRLNGLIGISQEVVSDLKTRMRKADVSLFYNLHDIDSIINKSNEKSVEITKDNSEIEILCLGTIDYNKRQDLILKALELNPNKNIKLYIVGKVIEDSYYQELLKFVDDKNMKEQVQFIPFLSNPYPLLKRVDFLVSLSESEGLPGVVIESLLLNTPVICTNSSQGIWEILDAKDLYKNDLKDMFVAEKGLILPNPKDVDVVQLISLINSSIEFVVRKKEVFLQNKFIFQESVAKSSIHSFFKYLNSKLNEFNN